MILTRKQEEGLKIAVERHRNHEKYTVISGFAGTGKSTLVKFIIEALNVEKSKVCYATFTGKAAEVLRKKGNENACTLHKLLYHHIPRPGGGFFRKPKTALEYDIIVVDEVSMAPKKMMDLLFSHKCYVICLGDPFQIPPIDEKEDNHLLENPHIFLDEIMRQAAESDIIRLSMDIREEKTLSDYMGETARVLSRKKFEPAMLTWADEVLVSTNKNRIMYNNQIRKMLGRGPEPEDGDKIVCLRNYWDDISEGGDALVNGTIGYLSNPQNVTVNFPPYARTSVRSVGAIQADIITDSGDLFACMNLDKEMILTGKPCLDWRDSYALGKIKERCGDLVPKEAAYGYAITGHKAQGSEWDKILVIEEGFPFVRIDHARWLYTCVTRAREKLVLLRND